VSVVALVACVVAAAMALRLLELRRRLELVAAAEHELRGPLTALILRCEAIGRDRAATASRERLGKWPPDTEQAPDTEQTVDTEKEPDVAETFDAEETIDCELERMRIGLADLDAARHGRRSRPCAEVVSLEQLARAAVAGWRPAARGVGGDVRFDWQAGTAAVLADRRRLAQVLANLLANAVEHGAAKVALTGRLRSGGVRIEVRDAGPGFSSPPLAQRGTSRGRGLGIARQAVEEAHGRLTIAPAQRGARVAVDLPLNDS